MRCKVGYVIKHANGIIIASYRMERSLWFLPCIHLHVLALRNKLLPRKGVKSIALMTNCGAAHATEMKRTDLQISEDASVCAGTSRCVLENLMW